MAALNRRRFSIALVALVLLAGLMPLLAAAPVLAQSSLPAETRFLRIGTGPTSGTYFPAGGLIANAISNPPGSRPCDKGGSCGVPGLIAVAQSTNGAVSNVEAVGRGDIELGLSQTDIAYWAYHGTGLYQGKGAVEKLRAVAFLYQESFHLVVRRDSGITTPAGLKGKTISVGEDGSGTQVGAMAILEAYGVSRKDVKLVNLRPGPSADALSAKEIDAFFFVAGVPTPTVASLAADGVAALVPINGEPVKKLAAKFPFLLPTTIPAETYDGVAATPTLAVGALLVCNADLPEDLVYGITSALWHANNRPLFVKGLPVIGAQMQVEKANKGIGIPLHAGAANYYFDHGIAE